IQNGYEQSTLTTQGAVRLWLGPRGQLIPGNKFDFMGGKLVVHYGDGLGQSDQGAFAIYNGSRVPTRIGGSLSPSSAANPKDGSFYAVVYSLNSDILGYYGTIDFAGVGQLVKLRGSATAADIIQTSGDLWIDPAKADTPWDPYTYVLYYAV